jgi:DNA polymerase-3 subunit delta
MVAYKAAQVSRFLNSPDPSVQAVLLYGPEQALVSDRAGALARQLAAAQEPEGDILRLDDRDLGEEPGKLATELQTLPMFGGRKILRVEAGSRFPSADLATLLAEPLEAFLIVEAGNLRPTSALRKAFEKAENAAALPCYEISSRDMGSFIDQELVGHKVSIETGAKQHLVTLLGGDQARARGELEKLALYVGEGGTITQADIDAALGDISQAALDRLAIAAGNRNAKEALAQLDRLVATGQSPQGALMALTRYFERLHKVCVVAESGGSLKSVLAGFRPPVHFRQRDALESQSRNWTSARVARAIELTSTALRSARRQPDLERQFAERLLVVLS